MDNFDSTIDMISSFIDKSIELIKLSYVYQHYIIATIVILLVLLILIRLKRHFSPIKLFDNNNGIVSIKKKALYELVESVCYDMGSLSKPKIKIQAKKRRLFLDISLKIESQQRLVDFTSKLQEEIQFAFVQQLGIEKVGKVNVNICDFRGLNKKPLSYYQKTLDSTKKEEKPTEESIAESEI